MVAKLALLVATVLVVHPKKQHKPVDLGWSEILDPNCSPLSEGLVLYFTDSQLGIASTCTEAMREARDAKPLAENYRI